MRFWELLRLALEGIRRRPVRALLTTLGVAIASGALVSMVGYALGFQSQMEDSIEVLGLLNQIEVTAPAVRKKSADEGESASGPVLDEQPGARSFG